MELISIKNEKNSHSFQGLTIQQIEIFLTVARHLNYSQAAKDLYLSQPAVSSRIKSMEDTVGFRLFIRKNRGVELTPEGSELYTRLEHAYQRFRVAVNMIVRDMSPTPKLNVGCLNSDEIVRLTDTAVSRFREAHAAVDIVYEMYNYNELTDKLICGELDVIITMHFDVRDRENINFKPVGPVPYYFVFPKSWDTGLNDVGAILHNKTLILELNNGYNHALELCRRNGFMPSQVKYADSYLKISKAIAEGSCFTIGSRDIAKDSHFQACLSFVQIKDHEEQLAAAWVENKPWVKEFLELL